MEQSACSPAKVPAKREPKRSANSIEVVGVLLACFDQPGDVEPNPFISTSPPQIHWCIGALVQVALEQVPPSSVPPVGILSELNKTWN